MHNLISFRSFYKQPLREQSKLKIIDFSNWRGRENWTNEDVSTNTKKKMMIQLEKLLKSHDFYFVYANGRSYDKGKDEQEAIENLVREIDTSDGSKDALKLYRKYLRKNESVTNESTNKMDIHLSMSDEFLEKILGVDKEKKRSKKDKSDDDEIVDVKPKIKETLDYMDTKNWFPDMSNVRATGSLNSCDTERKDRPLGISYFTDGGDLSFNRPKFVPPSEKYLRDLNRKRTI